MAHMWALILKELPFKGLKIRIPIIVPCEGRGLVIKGLRYGPTCGAVGKPIRGPEVCTC